MGTSWTQHRGAQVPTGNDLQQQVQYLRQVLGLNGAGPLSYFSVQDTNGIQRVRVGYLPNGDYGLQVFDKNNVSTEFLPVYYNSYTTSFIQNSGGSYAAVNSGGITNTVIVGNSGKVKVTASTTVGPTGGGSGLSGGYLGVGIGSATPTGVLSGLAEFLMPAGSVGIGVECSASTTVVVTGLTPGSTVFKLYSATTGSYGATFTNTYVAYEPI